MLTGFTQCFKVSSLLQYDVNINYLNNFSVKPKEEKKELVIPLIKTNNWRTENDSKTGTDRPRPKEGIESQAVQEILNGKTIHHQY